ncbi:unnamed protein product [Rotaria sordida]|uniref:Uncharacterized protein n=1 Tax=Rotaria sordida TaxID=392033 RepID=A0A815RAT7_9BILA|nr:unnamed protein product [Rotaria sordida]
MINKCFNFSENKNNYHGKNIIATIWYLFSGREKRNILIYMIGLMLYKFGLEAFNGSIVSLATNRYDRDAYDSGGSAHTFEKVGLLVGLNQACQCIGSILIAPIIKHWQTRIALSISIFFFALCTALLMIIDAVTGGKIKPSYFRAMYENDYSYYGNYQTNIIIPIYCITGITYGMIELIRRISGVTGALTTGLVFIPQNQNIKRNYFKSLINGFYLFGKSIYVGGKIIFTNRKYIWLFPCYSLEFYVHRYIENGIAPQIAKRYFQNSEWSQIIVAGSNFGEFLGAIFVFFLTKKIRSPIILLRLDSGDDISLNADIQSSLSKSKLKNKDISSLGSVMVFLYSSYIILYAILNPLLGKYIDQIYNTNQTIRPAFIYTVGVQITIISILMAISTFIPRDSFKLNPSLK